ncbi:hypothetical protein [Nocardia terpenica]|uniref:Uncharacterized protein n=1 Tax=Nocardia terpenica TaxID=455432 RepID=A0A6G9YVL7_9NOCA|nr:hypothetical protein [Nocardia terpenica]QIS17141.1 hypothetical protein F6W96_01235 [Nocardia terpenica]
MNLIHRAAVRPAATAVMAVLATVLALTPVAVAAPPTTTPPGWAPPPPNAPGSGRTPWKFQPDGTSTVEFDLPVANEIVRLHTHFTVPAQPPAVGTMFLWPGLEPSQGGRNYDPVGLGVLQPVLTWGDSCAPTAQPPTYSSWWISGQYVNVGNDPDFSGCRSGSAMAPQVGDALDADFTLDQSTGVWTQTVTGPSGSVTYAINLQQQAQNRAIFAIEPWDNAQYAGPLVFSDTTITFRDDSEQSCTQPSIAYGGAGGTISAPTAIDAKHCHVDTISVNGQSVTP